MDDPAIRATIAQQALGADEVLVAAVKVMEHIIKTARRQSKLRLLGISLRDGKPRFVIIKILAHGGYKLYKMWKLDDVSRVVGDSGLEKRFHFALHIDKVVYRFSTDSLSRRDEFLWAIASVAKRLCKILPEMQAVDLTKLKHLYQHLVYVDEASASGTTPDGAPVLASARAAPPLRDIDWDVADASALERRLLSELLGLESANVYALVQSEQPLVASLDGIDETLGHLDALDNILLTMKDRLQKLAEDMGTIEAANTETRRQTTNQKTLLDELHYVLQSLTLEPDTVALLLDSSFDSSEDIAAATAAAQELQRVLLAQLDGLEEMAAVRERTNEFKEYRRRFSVRLYEHLEKAIESLADACVSNLRGQSGHTLTLATHEAAVHAPLLPFAQLTLWLKAIDPQKLTALQEHYTKQMARAYKRQIKDIADALNLARLVRTAGDEADAGASAAGARDRAPSLAPSSKRKSMHFKGDDDDRSIARSFEGSGQGSRGGGSGAPPALDAYASLLEAVVPVTASERTFAVNFFHLAQDDMVTLAGPSSSPPPPTSTSTRAVASPSNDGDISQVIREGADSALRALLGKLFEVLVGELNTLVEGCLKADPVLSIAFAVTSEELQAVRLATSTFLQATLDSLIKARCIPAFERFVAAEMLVIQESRNATKKRAGVLKPFRSFPMLVARLECFLGPIHQSETRSVVNNAYTQLASRLLSSLPLFLPDGPLVSTDPAVFEAVGADPKEARDALIVVAENCHHLHASLSGRKIACLDPFVKTSKALYDQYRAAYVGAAVSKGMGRIGEFFAGVDALLLLRKEDEVAFNLAYNKASLRKIAGATAGKDLRKGLEGMYKDIEKHFSSDGGLFQVVWHDEQHDVLQRIAHAEDLARRCYSQSLGELIGISSADVTAYLAEISRITPYS